MNTHTTRARAAAQRDYLAFARGSNRDDLAAWVNNMRSRGLAANTIRQRVCLVRHWLDRKENVTLPARCNVRERKWLNPEQVQAMLAIIPNNESGRLAFALITAFLITGLRLGQVRNWSWSDFRREVGYGKSQHAKALKRIEQLKEKLDQSRGQVHALQDKLFGRKTDIPTTCPCHLPPEGKTTFLPLPITGYKWARAGVFLYPQV